MTVICGSFPNSVKTHIIYGGDGMDKIINFISMFEQSIGLKDPWKVEKANFSEDNKAVHIYIAARKTAEYPCPECGKSCKRFDDEDEERVWRHGDVVFFPSYVHCKRPRIKCEEHGVCVTEAPWARKFSRYTLLFEGYAMLLLQNMTIEAARKLLRISHTSLTNIMVYWVEKAVSEDDLSQVRSICIDETSFKRGHSYVTVVSDADERRVIGVEEGRSIESVERFSIKLEKKGGECADIRAVSCDMSKAYLSAKDLCFPNALAVTDKFHVKQLLLKGMDEVRRSEQGKWNRNRKAGRKLLMIPQSKMTDEQKVATTELLMRFPKTGRAFSMVQSLDEFYKCTRKKQAERKLKHLMGWMDRSRLDPMKTVSKTLKENQATILNYFDNRITNALAEGLNSMIQMAKRRARGFATLKGYKCMIFLVVGRLKLSCPEIF